MNYRIVEKEAFKIVGIMKRVPIVFNGVNPEIAAMFQPPYGQYSNRWDPSRIQGDCILVKGQSKGSIFS